MFCRIAVFSVTVFYDERIVIVASRGLMPVKKTASSGWAGFYRCRPIYSSNCKLIVYTYTKSDRVSRVRVPSWGPFPIPPHLSLPLRFLSDLNCPIIRQKRQKNKNKNLIRCTMLMSWYDRQYTYTHLWLYCQYVLSFGGKMVCNDYY